MADVNIIVLGSPDPANLNAVGPEVYAVWDGTDFIYADGTNNADLPDLALGYLADDPTAQQVVKVVEADLQSSRPNDALTILRTTRTTAVPTGKTIVVEP
ncbi:hypothetical protein [Coleofasciculus sp. F4-SAH-05]|uniref:hypothetical protein n=1 Tax=Coleofasciculus sp. F4-SAH-05 TaxID=3069525 RepID=UPI0033028674